MAWLEAVGIMAKKSFSVQNDVGFILFSWLRSLKLVLYHILHLVFVNNLHQVCGLNI